MLCLNATACMHQAHMGTHERWKLIEALGTQQRGGFRTSVSFVQPACLWDDLRKQACHVLWSDRLQL